MSDRARPLLMREATLKLGGEDSSEILVTAWHESELLMISDNDGFVPTDVRAIYPLMKRV